MEVVIQLIGTMPVASEFIHSTIEPEISFPSLSKKTMTIDRFLMGVLSFFLFVSGRNATQMPQFQTQQW